MIKHLAILVIGICIGWTTNNVYTLDKNLTCADYHTKHTIWQGFISERDGDIRCFWLEGRFPWRVRQGVPVR